MSFEQQLEVGKVGESLVAKWLMRRGHSVLPVYEIADNQYKGPALFTADGSIISPDMLVFNKGNVFWVEAKYKSAFTWHRKTERFVTGIDRNHYREYLKVSQKIGMPVWLFFLHKPGEAKDTPAGMISPSGLFGGDIEILSGCINHEHDGWGRHGMVYWSHESLKLIAKYEDVR